MEKFSINGNYKSINYNQYRSNLTDLGIGAMMFSGLMYIFDKPSIEITLAAGGIYCIGKICEKFNKTKIEKNNIESVLRNF